MLWLWRCPSFGLSEQELFLALLCPEAANRFEELVATWSVCVRADGRGKDGFAKALTVKTSSVSLC